MGYSEMIIFKKYTSCLLTGHFYVPPNFSIAEQPFIDQNEVTLTLLT
jgi:hypothetical protein